MKNRRWTVALTLALVCATAAAGCAATSSTAGRLADRLQIRFASVPVERLEGMASVWAYAEEVGEPADAHGLYRRNGVRVGRVGEKYARRVMEVLERDLDATLSPTQLIGAYPRSEAVVPLARGRELQPLDVEFEDGRGETFAMARRGFVLRVALESLTHDQATISLSALLVGRRGSRERRTLEGFDLSFLCARGDFVLIGPSGPDAGGWAPLFTRAADGSAHLLFVSVGGGDGSSGV